MLLPQVVEPIPFGFPSKAKGTLSFLKAIQKAKENLDAARIDSVSIAQRNLFSKAISYSVKAGSKCHPMLYTIVNRREHGTPQSVGV